MGVHSCNRIGVSLYGCNRISVSPSGGGRFMKPAVNVGNVMVTSIFNNGTLFGNSSKPMLGLLA